MISPAKSAVPPGKRYRSIWISDLHLGTRHVQVDALLDFLRESACRYL